MYKDIMNIIERVIEEGGGQEKLGKTLGICRAAVAMWKINGRIPVHHVLRIEAATKIRREEIRPDIYPPEVS